MARLSMLVLAALALIAALLSTAANAQGMSGGVAVAPSAQEILPGAEMKPNAGMGAGTGSRHLLKKKKSNATTASGTGRRALLKKKKKSNATTTTTMGGH